MQAPCESISRRWLPRVKSLLVNILYREYDLSQVQISKLLGVSQSSVSRYLNEQRGVWKQLDSPELMNYLRKVAEKIVREEMERERILCEICKFLRSQLGAGALAA
uniref:Helix-turn-helix domain-containing protein n=1 Tax=Thermofilum pendens TaxID=2269 RepID=A0A7C3WJZ3_THEPE